MKEKLSEIKQKLDAKKAEHKIDKLLKSEGYKVHEHKSDPEKKIKKELLKEKIKAVIYQMQSENQDVMQNLSKLANSMGNLLPSI